MARTFVAISRQSTSWLNFMQNLWNILLQVRCREECKGLNSFNRKERRREEREEEEGDRYRILNE